MTQIRVPNLGEGAESGEVVSVLVKVGDEIAEGDVIVELENEKAVAPIPSPESGTVSEIHVKEGDDVSVGNVLISLSSNGADAPAEPSTARPQPTAQTPTVAEAPAAQTSQYESLSGAPPPASPSLKKMARQLGIDLRRVPGSERGGRITHDDVRNYINHLQQLAFGEKPAAPTQSDAPAAPKPAPVSVDFSKWGEVRKEPMTRLRRTIARRLHESWTQSPHVTQFDEADITDLMALRKEHRAAYEERGAKLTLTPFLIRALVGALKEHPIFNASLDEAANEVVYKEYVHLGIAVDTEGGLIVPVIRDIDRKSLLEISQELDGLAERARDRKVSPDELQGGSFTLSNQGGIGGGHFTPIINPPEVAILGVGRGGYKPLVVDGEIVPRMTMPLTVSYDHRLIDGGAAARFITQIVQTLQNFPEDDVKLEGDDADGTDSD